MRAIHLHGALGEKFGPRFDLDIETASEAVRALCANFPGFEKEIMSGSWHVVRGDPDTGLPLGEEEITSFRLGKADLHILPHVAGAKNGGVAKAILGVALVGLSFGLGAAGAAPIIAGASATWGNTIGMLGLSMALQGVSTMLSPQDTSEGEKEERSYLLSGTTGTGKEGTGLPIIYGEVITGGIIISAGLDIETEDKTVPPKQEVDDAVESTWPGGVHKSSD